MTISIKIPKLEQKKIQRLMDKLSLRKGGKSVYEGIIRKALEMIRMDVVTNSLSNQTLKRRSGNLANSIQSKVVKQGTQIGGTVGSGVRRGARMPYANVQETGGVIRPKKAKWLTIPLPSNLTATGQMRFNARELIATGSTFVRPSKNGKGKVMFLVKNGRPVPVFALKKSVKIKASKYLELSTKRMAGPVAKMIIRGLEEVTV